MKKRQIATILGLGMTASGVALSLGIKPVVMVSAGGKNETILDDNFNNSEHSGSLDSSKWIDKTGDHSIKQSGSAISYLRTDTPQGGGEGMLFSTRHKISSIQKITFDFRVSSSGSRWFSPTFFGEDLSQTENWNKWDLYSNPFLINKEKAVSLGSTGMATYDFSKLGVSDGDAWLSAEIVVTDAHHGSLNFAPIGTAFDDSKKVSFTYDKMSCDLTNAYFGLATSHDPGSVDFDNVSIVSDSGILTQDFSSFRYEEDEDWTFFTKDFGAAVPWYVFDSSSLGFSNAQQGDFIYSKAAVQEDTSSIEDVEVLRLSFAIKFDVGCTNEKVAIVLGVNPKNPKIEGDVVRYEMTKNGGLLCEYQDGVKTSDDSMNGNVWEKASSEGAIVTLSIKKNGSVMVLENDAPVKNNSGEAVSFGQVGHIYGAIGIAALTPINGTVSLDSVRAINSSYYVPVTKSVTHNFSNSFFGNKGKEDFIVIDGDGAGKMHVSDGKLVWERASDGTFFGSAHQYDSFILDFKLCNILVKEDFNSGDAPATGKDKWIGLDLSRSSKFDGAYGNYCTTLTRITSNDKEFVEPGLYKNDITSSLDRDLVREIKYRDIPTSLFKAIQYTSPVEESSVKDGDAVCFRYVSDGSSLKQYMKKANEPEYTLYYEYKNLELNGYFALCCTGFTYCKIDDFSMANTSSVYIPADNETPDTIVEKETDVIYDHNNPDVNLDEEIRINTHPDGKVLPVALGVASGVFAVAFIGTLVALLKKKGGKR
ncbi:MAG: hypothetical protein PUE65_03945 [Mollicutes bacterium]|nr:hypothetical protein [Mollicutes bacterium]